jgi:hypothetical protein
MPDVPVEQAVKENCQALLIGDLMRVMNDLTPEAMAQVMQGGGGNMGAMPALRSFDIQSHDEQGDDHVFKIKFEGDQDFTAIATWRDVGDLTPEAMQQLMPLMAGGPTAATSNSVTPVSSANGDHVFDVTYSDNDGKSVSMRETVRELDGKWRIVKLEKPS